MKSIKYLFLFLFALLSASVLAATPPVEEVYVIQLGYGDTVDAPVAKAGVTNAIIHYEGSARWFLYANNPTATPVDYMVDSAAVIYLIKGTTVIAASVREQNYGHLPEFTSVYTPLFDNGETIAYTAYFPIALDPGELANFSSPHTLQIFPYLNVTSVGCDTYGATPVPGNIVTVTITYQYPGIPGGGDDDDCDAGDDDDNNDGHHGGGHGDKDKGDDKGHGKPVKPSKSSKKHK